MAVTLTCRCDNMIGLKLNCSYSHHIGVVISGCFKCYDTGVECRHVIPGCLKYYDTGVESQPGSNIIIWFVLKLIVLYQPFS